MDPSPSKGEENDQYALRQSRSSAQVFRAGLGACLLEWCGIDFSGLCYHYCLPALLLK